MNSNVDTGNSTQGSDATPPRVVVVGAGPAGLTAAHELSKRGQRPLLLEATTHVGGIARTEHYKGFHFDIGGHRFFTKVKEIEELWLSVLGDDFIKVPRMSRIYFSGKFYDYPLRFGNALRNLGIYESTRVLLNYLKWQILPHAKEDSFEEWIQNRFGDRLYYLFFQTYTEKIWGIPCAKIRSDWAAQRIKGLSLAKAVINSLTGRNGTSTLIKEFYYPRLGPGMMWQAFRERVEENGGEVHLGSRVCALRHENRRVLSVLVEDGTAKRWIPAEHVISSMSLPSLIARLQPSAPDHVLNASRRLHHRDFLIVVLILDTPDPFPDNWIYIHDPDVRVGRIQNFRSWSADMVPDPTKSSLGMEYFCHNGDGLWTMDDNALINLAARELAKIGLGEERDIVDGTVIRQPQAYPVYDETYQENLEIIKDYLSGFGNLHTVGRNGMHRYNNQDHSMLTALLAARNILGERHDLWSVNVERSYHEETMMRSRPALPALHNHGEAIAIPGRATASAATGNRYRMEGGDPPSAAG